MHPYLRLHLRVRPAEGKQEASLPAARVRRVLGKAFIDTFCPFGEPRCQAAEPGSEPRPRPQDLCRLATACPYGVLFAASANARPPFALHTAEIEGDRSVLEITLYGAAWRLYPWVLQSLDRAFAVGLGSERRPWTIDDVYRVRPDRRRDRLCGAGLTGLDPTLAPDLLNLGIEPFLSPQPVEIRLLSPARLLQAGRLLPGRAPVSFELLVARILDRFRGLYGDDASEILHPSIRRVLEAEAAQVPLLESETEWMEVQDYSARTGAELLLGGKVGRLVYGPGAARFFPLLHAGEILHLGKNPTAGCGRIEVRLPAG
ncbi:MAG TPA: CRISPR system precrRNA processing endoribonuclease RAMP protein Cas6 [Thermoanaerobaculia bacterium]|nr:CRISPR system precrRNA processing endoribonuclease RAMP protein Cas6 [Thermoanaerobaculia bacterium]